MNKNLRLLLVAVQVLSSMLVAHEQAKQESASQIIQYPSMSIVREHVKSQDTLVIFDLDNTVFTMHPGHVNDLWFTAMVQHARSLGYDELGAVQAVLPYYLDRQKVAPVSAVEEQTPAIIEELQQRGVPVIALTTRSVILGDSTINQLKSIGVNFNKTAVSPFNISFSLQCPAAFKQGVMFCGNNAKGASLKALFQATGYKPKKIVFIDDKEKYLHDVAAVANELGVACVGIRYSKLDDEVARYVLDDASKLLVKPNANKTIVEHDSVDAVLQYATKNSVVLFDLDETLWEQTDAFGDGIWLQKLIRYGIDDLKMTNQEVTDILLPIYHEAQHAATFKPVEAQAPALVKSLQDQGIPVFGLTARRLELVHPTLSKLRDIGIDFSRSRGASEPVSFNIEHPNIFVQGVMFCGGAQSAKSKHGTTGHAKDKAVKALLKYLQVKPDRVIVIDDQKHYLNDVVQAVNELGIDCVGVRYTRTDTKRADFVLDAASKALLERPASTVV